MTQFSVPKRWRIPEEALRHSFIEMARDGARGCEGVAMWLGHHNNDETVITHVVRLQGPGILKEPDRLVISADLVNDLTDVAIEHKLTLVGQIHSHGPWHGTDLSETDKRYGIAVPGFLSAVAPDYALRHDTPIDECGIHVFLPAEGWTRLSRDQVRERIAVVSGVAVPLLVAGSIG